MLKAKYVILVCLYHTLQQGGEGNLRPRRPPHEYLGEYTSWGKPKIPPADRIFMDPGRVYFRPLKKGVVLPLAIVKKG